MSMHSKRFLFLRLVALVVSLIAVGVYVTLPALAVWVWFGRWAAAAMLVSEALLALTLALAFSMIAARWRKSDERGSEVAR